MLRFADIRRGLAGLTAAAVLIVSIATPAAGGDELIVQPGDTLWDIAQAHGTTVASLVALNQIENPSLIRIGQRIVLRPPATSTAPAPVIPEAPAPIVYVVRPGDTLWAISVHYGTTIAVLAEANGIENPSLIRIGQPIAIPQVDAAPAAAAVAAAATAPAATAPGPVIHVVQRGETLWAISGRYGVSIQAIVDANGLSSASFIRTGQQLVIPGTASGQPAPSTVTIAAMSPEMAATVSARAGARDMLLQAAEEFAVPGAFVLAVAWHESGWQQGAVSSAGAVGLMQLMPDTADWVAGSMLHEAPAITDARWNARAGACLLAFYLAHYGGDKVRTLAAYLQGMGSVDQIGVLVTSLAYVDNILALETVFSQ